MSSEKTIPVIPTNADLQEAAVDALARLSGTIPPTQPNALPSGSTTINQTLEPPAEPFEWVKCSKHLGGKHQTKTRCPIMVKRMKIEGRRQKPTYCEVHKAEIVEKERLRKVADRAAARAARVQGKAFVQLVPSAQVIE